ncbi:MAG: glucuronate isomerase [Streptosporangiaceae bacterium]
MTTPLALHPDRLLPADPGIRAIARRLYESVCELPIVSPHGHVDPQLLLRDEPLPDPAALLITPDHYVTRLLHAAGTALEDLGLGLGRLSESQARRAWRLLCGHWDIFRGTPVRYWLECELAEIFDVTLRPSAATSDAIYDQISECLAKKAFRPRALLDGFGVEVLATTDDPADDLAAHAALAADTSFRARVIPTFRPDRYLEPAMPGWSAAVDALGAAAAEDVGDYPGYLRALTVRRQHFIARGATSADHSHLDVRTDPLPLADAARMYRDARRGEATASELLSFRRNMLFEMARMSVEDGLVMTLHPAIWRNHHGPTTARFGPDTGHDIPVAAEFTDALRPVLDRFGTAASFHLVLFTTDETVFSREIAPLAGFYPAVYAGAPWWFLDAPDAISRYRAAVTETAGFSRTSGFIDDTRALCSIKARHDMARRLDSGYLARLVAEHRLQEQEAASTLQELVTVNPRRAFKL